jgi:hypothetical protein
MCLTNALAAAMGPLFVRRWNIVQVAWHRQSLPHDIGIVCVPFGRHWTGIVNLVERL